MSRISASARAAGGVGLDRRHRIVGRIHAVGIGVAQVLDRLLGALGRAAVPTQIGA